MSHARNQRRQLARVLRWARTGGWKRSAFSGDYQRDDVAVKWHPVTSDLLIEHFQIPIGWVHYGALTVDSIETAVNVLAALGLIPAHMCELHDVGYTNGYGDAVWNGEEAA